MMCLNFGYEKKNQKKLNTVQLLKNESRTLKNLDFTLKSPKLFKIENRKLLRKSLKYLMKNKKIIGTLVSKYFYNK